MEKIKCPQCGLTLIFANYIDAEIKCNRCKQITRIQKIINAYLIPCLLVM